MRPHSLLPTLLTALLLHLHLTTAAQSATSFCKCVCAGNSTIIALNPPSSSSSSSHHKTLKFSRSIPAVLPRSLQRRQDGGDGGGNGAGGGEQRQEEEEEDQKQGHHTPTCADCNRAFCIDQGLQICRDVKAEEVFASCFQRDSLKDELVVILFLACTGGLLGWAVLKPFVERLWEGSGVVGLALPMRSGGGRGDSGGGSSSRGGFLGGRGGGGGAGRVAEAGSSRSRRRDGGDYADEDEGALEGEPLRSS